MDPFQMRILHDTSRNDRSRSSFRNPDNFFPERDVAPPDPIFRWAKDAAEDRIAALERRTERSRRTWRQMIAGWALMLRRLARGTR